MKALVGIDGSANSLAAAAFVGRLLSPERDELELLFVLPPWSFDSERLEESIERRAKAAVSRTLLEAAASQLPQGWRGRVSCSEKEGQPSEQILGLLETQRFDMVVVGNLGTGGALANSALGEFVLGSVSRAIVYSATISVLVVKNGEGNSTPAAESAKPFHILAAYGDDHFAARASALLNQFSLPDSCRGWVMTAIQPMHATHLPRWATLERDPDVAAMAAAWEAEHQQCVQQASKELAARRGALPACFAAQNPIVAEGRPAEQILAQLSEKHIELAILGARSHGPIKRMLLGSVSSQVLRQARCSMLIVR